MKFSVVITLFSLFVCAVFAQQQSELDANDLKVLNYALFLERLEANFYNIFQAKYADADFAAAGANPNLRAHIETIRAHENAHVAFLETALGANAIKNCSSYDFSKVTSVPTYIAVAKLLESTGVSAYDGAVNSITNRQFAQIAATIATVEARHAAYLNNITTNFPIDAAFTGAFDTALGFQTVFNAVVTNFNPQGCQIPVAFQTLTIDPSQASVKLVNTTVVNSPNQAYFDANDAKVLQYALVLENLEYAFYHKYNAQFATTFSGVNNATLVQAYLNLIEAHESIHVSTLTSIVGASNAIPACTTYNFAVILGREIATVGDFLAAAKVLENTGVSAYDYAIASITNKNYQQAAATIATIEARHASFINDQLNPTSATAPFPNITDVTLTRAQVVNAVGPILNGCVSSSDLAKTNFDDFFNIVSLNTTSTSTSSSSTSATSTSTISTSTTTTGATGATGTSSTTTSAAPAVAFSAVAMLFAVIAALL